MIVTSVATIRAAITHCRSRLLGERDSVNFETLASTIGWRFMALIHLPGLFAFWHVGTISAICGSMNSRENSFLLKFLWQGIIATVCSVQIAAGDVLIYKAKLTSSETGGGKVTKTSVSGYIVVNPETDAIAELLAIPLSRQFDVTWPNNLVATQIPDGPQKQETVISVGAAHFGTLSARGGNVSLDIDNLTAEGVDALLKTGTTNQWIWPRSFRVAGTNVNTSANTTNRCKGVYSYDQPDTILANTVSAGGMTQTVRSLQQSLTKLGYSQNAVPTSEVDGTFDSASYDVTPYKFWGDYFASHYYDMYPQFTNHIYSVSRSGASWENQFESQQEKYCLPLWASFGTASTHDWMLANDNSSYLSNDVIQWGTNLFNAPPLFWNGTAVTNEGGIASTLSVTHYSLGGIPTDTSDGDSGAVSRNAGAMALAELYGTPVVDMWHLLWTNGLSGDIVGPRLFGFFPGGHPYPAGHLCMAIQSLVALGAETNVGSLTLNWTKKNATTNHCVASGITVATNALSCTVHFDRMPMAWDVPNGTITNDARNAFVVMPELGNAFQWMIRVTNAPPGTYALNVDGVQTDVATDAELAAGRNWFTNYNGPLWAQRASVLAWKRIQAGCDPVTLNLSHDAGSLGILGASDLLNFQSWASQEYDTLNLRGDAYINSMTNFVAQLRQYDVAINQAAQQTNHVLTVTLMANPGTSSLRSTRR